MGFDIERPEEIFSFPIEPSKWVGSPEISRAYGIEEKKEEKDKKGKERERRGQERWWGWKSWPAQTDVMLADLSCEKKQKK